jgi:hypothetical protein
VHLAIRSSPLVESPAARLLGEAHPLVRSLDRRATLHLELLVVGALLLGGLLGVAGGVHAGLPVALAAGVAGTSTWLRLMLAIALIRSLVLELLAEGRESLPLAELQKARCRLLDVRHRRTQAQWLERVAAGRDLGFGLPPRVPPLISPLIAAEARCELLDVAAALARGAQGVAGLALLEQLASEPWSPLFDDDVQAVREALSRVRFLLAA